MKSSTRSNVEVRWPRSRTAVAAVLLLAGAGAAAGQNPEQRAPAREESTMTSGIGIVEAFVEAFNQRDVDRIMTFFTDDAIYHNLPMEPVEGAAAVRQAIEAYVPISQEIDWEMVHAAQAGDTVLTERIDRFVIGGRKVVLPVMGAFDLRDGKIAAWRDYFDMATWTRQMGGSGS